MKRHGMLIGGIFAIFILPVFLLAETDTELGSRLLKEKKYAEARVVLGESGI